VNDDRGLTIDGRAKPLGAYPHVRRAGDLLYVSGTSSRRPDDTIAGADVTATGVELDVAAQTAGVLDNLAAILAAVGATLADLVAITTYLVSMDDFAAYNQVYGTYFAGGGPTRTTVAVAALPHPHLLIEMQAVAHLPAERATKGANR